MSPIDRGIDLIGDILNCASLHFMHTQTKESFIRVVNKMRYAKVKINHRHHPRFMEIDLKSIKQDEMEM